MTKFNLDQFGNTIVCIKRQYELEKGDWIRISGKSQKAKDADVLDPHITRSVWDQAIEHAKKEFVDQEDSQRAAADRAMPSADFIAHCPPSYAFRFPSRTTNPPGKKTSTPFPRILPPASPATARNSAPTPTPYSIPLPTLPPTHPKTPCSKRTATPSRNAPASGLRNWPTRARTSGSI